MPKKPEKHSYDKKVLLRERKRHTACRIASTRCAALSNPDLVGGEGSQVWGGTWSQVQGRYPVPGQGGTPSQVWGRGYPIQTWLGGVLWVFPPDLGWSTPLPRPGIGYPHYLDLGWGTPLPRPEMEYPPYPDLRWGTPPPPQVWTD